MVLVLPEWQKLLERAPTSSVAGLTPPAEGSVNIIEYPGYLPDIPCYDDIARIQVLVGVDGALKQNSSYGPRKNIGRRDQAILSVVTALHTMAGPPSHFHLDTVNEMHMAISWLVKLVIPIAIKTKTLWMRTISAFIALLTTVPSGSFILVYTLRLGSYYGMPT